MKKQRKWKTEENRNGKQKITKMGRKTERTSVSS